MKIGLFFGSFNPVHIGHMIIANYMYSQTDLNEVWLVVSPHNPLKSKNSLARDYDRLHLVRLAIGDNPGLKASDVEFHLPVPSYTIHTLTCIKEKYPEKEFVLIMGSDNLATLNKWKNFEIILRDYSIYAYLRPANPSNPFEHLSNIKVFDAPLMQISSTYIRKCIADGKSIRYLTTDAVADYIEASNLYQ